MQKLAEICVRRPVFATMIILSITVVGMFSFRSLGVDLFPKIDLPTITVTVVNPGASPQEIETEITDKVEGAVNTISGIDELRSTSVEGVSQVFINFVDNTGLDAQGFAPFGQVVEGIEVVDKLYSGYGRQNVPDQGRITAEGNAYLVKEYPKLDYIKSATIEK